MTWDLERFRQDYHPLLLRQLSRQDESGLGAAYDLGRDAMLQGIGLLDVVRVHEELVLGVLATSRDVAEAEQVARVAAALLVDLLASYDMSHRGFMDVALSRGEEEAP